MKKTIYQLTLSFFIALIFLSSCKKNDIHEDTITKNDALSIKEKVARLGFDTTSIVINAETIIVEGDIVLTKSDLNKTTPRQASSIDISNGVYPIDYSRHRYLKYYIDVSALSAWESAIVSAFTKYSVFPGFNLRFTRTTNINEADLKLESGSPAIADGQFPANGQLGVRIGVNTSYSYLTEAQKIFVIAHEIGHTIGFRHTNWRASESETAVLNGVSYGAYTIPGTINSNNNPDPASVFNSGVGSTSVGSWTNFSQFDQIALVSMYPSFISAQLTTSPNGSAPVGTGQNITASISVPNWREGGLTYQWAVQGVTITSNNGNVIRATVTDPNSAAVSCTITNAHGESISASKSFGPIEID